MMPDAMQEIIKHHEISVAQMYKGPIPQASDLSEYASIDGYKRTARSFIRNHATEEDLKEVESLIQERRKRIEDGEE